MIDDYLTALWQSLTGYPDTVELMDDGYFLVVGDDELDAIGDTFEDAETELRRAAVTDEMEWDHHYLRGSWLPRARTMRTRLHGLLSGKDRQTIRLDTTRIVVTIRLYSTV